MEEKKGVQKINIDSEFAKFYQDSRGAYMVNKPKNSEMPIINVSSNNVPGAWELAMISIWEYGASVPTHYDKPGDLPSKEASVVINVSNPFNEPRIHRNFPGGPAELEVYRQEVVDGIHDHWIDPMAGKWTYTYHERLFNYNPSKNLKSEDRGLLLPKGVNQIELIVNDLERDITSKGAQATTWMPSADPGLESNRPCLQRLWFRVLEDEKGEYALNLNSHWRSRDAYKAWLMNVHGITSLQQKVAEDLSNRIGKEIKVGSYTDISDSLHIYGAYFREFAARHEKMKTDEGFEKRVLAPGLPFYEGFIEGTEETREKLKKDRDYMKSKN